MVFADEPTGNLDSRASEEVLSFLRSCARELHQTVIMVTHDPVAASYAGRVLFLADGRVAGELLAPTPDTVLDHLRRAGDPAGPSTPASQPGGGARRAHARTGE